MPNTGYINGSDMLLSINGQCVGHCSSHAVKVSTENKEHSVKPLRNIADLTASLFAGRKVTKVNINITADGFGFYDEKEFGYPELLAKCLAGESVDVKCFERGQETKPYLAGKFVISSLDHTNPANDDSTYSISLDNDGQPEVDTAGLTTGSEKIPAISAT